MWNRWHPNLLHIHKTKNKDIIIKVYFSTLDILMNAMNDRSKQETIDIICAAVELINLDFNIDSSSLFLKFFNVVAENLKAKTAILKIWKILLNLNEIHWILYMNGLIGC